MPVLNNPKHERFAQLVAGGCSNRSSYVSAGYKADSNQNTIDASASALLSNPKVSERVSELKLRASKAFEKQRVFTKERVLNRLDHIGDLAELAGQYQVSRGCEELIGKTLGIFVERQDVNLKRIDELAPDELAALLSIPVEDKGDVQ